MNNRITLYSPAILAGSSATADGPGRTPTIRRARMARLYSPAILAGSSAAAEGAGCMALIRRARMARLCGRRGISLLEVLISMFVLLFGLMGVAAVFPVGNHYAGRGEQYDRGAALADAAMAELKARGMLDSRVWMYADPAASIASVAVKVLKADGTPASPPLANAHVIQPALAPKPGEFNVTATAVMGRGHAFILDPLGTAAALEGVPRPFTKPIGNGIDVFPFARFDATYPAGVDRDGATIGTNTPNPWKPAGLIGDRFPLRRITVPSDDNQRPSMTPAVAETIFRLHDDLSVELPEESDRPGIQSWRVDSAGNALARDYKGKYSWLATIVPATLDGVSAVQPNYGSYGMLFDVSVAVFHDRRITPSAASERAVTAELNAGGELVLFVDHNDVYTSADILDAAMEGLRPGQWIALAGAHPTLITSPSPPVSPSRHFLLKWYRLLSLDDESDLGPNDTGISVASLPNKVAVRRAMLEGPGWPEPPMTSPTYPTVTNLRAIILPGVIGVSTQTLPLGE